MRRVSTLLLALAGCTLDGNGARAEIEREVPWFDALEVFGDFEVEVQVRPELGELDTITVRVSGDANALGRLFTQVHGDGTLTIALDPSLRTDLSLVPTATLEVPALTSVFTSDQARVTLTGGAPELALKATESSTIAALDLAGCTATASATGSGLVTLAGAGPFADLGAADQATIDASAFHADAAAVAVTDDATVHVCSLAAPEISGPAAQVTAACAE